MDGWMNVWMDGQCWRHSYSDSQNFLNASGKQATARHCSQSELITLWSRVWQPHMSDNPYQQISFSFPRCSVTGWLLLRNFHMVSWAWLSSPSPQVESDLTNSGFNTLNVKKTNKESSWITDFTLLPAGSHCSCFNIEELCVCKSCTCWHFVVEYAELRKLLYFPRCAANADVLSQRSFGVKQKCWRLK